jgi:hypothetical protein
LRATKREEYMLDLLTDASLDMTGMLCLFPPFFSLFAFSIFLLHILLFPLPYIGSFVDTAAKDQRVDARAEVLLRLARQHNTDFWADTDHTRRIVRFQNRAAQVRDFLDFCTSTLAMVYNAMFPQNPQPTNLPELMKKFKNVHQIHDLVKAQLMAGARFALIWLKICYPKLDLSSVIDACYSKLQKRRKNVDKLNDAVTPIAEKIIEELLRVDAAFFKEYHYADALGAPAEGERVTIDDLI